MKTIGLICEGVSEINVMETILSRYLGDEFLINALEPETCVENGIRKQAVEGGWSRVISHCNEHKISEVFQLNDFLVIQIDTDACEQYGVSPLDANNMKKTPEALYSDIVTRLCGGFSESFLQEYSGRIFFAICFNQIECWLLPLIIFDNNRCRTHNCIFTLNRELSRRNLPTIPPGDEKNSPNARKAYQRLLKIIKNKKSVEDISAFNYGFRRLIDDLQRNCSIAPSAQI